MNDDKACAKFSTQVLDRETGLNVVTADNEAVFEKDWDLFAGDVFTGVIKTSRFDYMRVTFGSTLSFPTNFFFEDVHQSPVMSTHGRVESVVSYRVKGFESGSCDNLMEVPDNGN